MTRAQRHSSFLAALVASVTALATPAAATDGVKLLTQPLNNNFPIVISQSGSYRLRKNITVPNANTTAIQISASATDVTLDLNGFTIMGPVVCSGNPTGPSPTFTCSPTGGGIGIEGAAGQNLTIRNGTIRGMGGDAIFTGFNPETVTIEGVKAISNGGNGINAYGPGSVSGVVALRNGQSGIFAARLSVSGCTAENNGEMGIWTAAAHVLSSRAVRNADHGIFVDAPGPMGSVVAGNIAQSNGDEGIRTESEGAVVRDNVASENLGDGIEVTHGVVAGNAAYQNGGNGFYVGEGSTAVANTARENGGTGLGTYGGTVVSQCSLMGNTQFGLQIFLSSIDATGYGENVADGNNGGNANAQVDVMTSGGSAFEIGTNVCGGDTTCP